MNRFIMVFGSILPVCLGFLLMAGVVSAQAPEKEKAAITEAEQWLALVDGGKYAESGTEAAGYFKNAVTQEKWVQSLKNGEWLEIRNCIINLKKQGDPVKGGALPAYNNLQ